ncbi:MAG TPA: hypothetical protein ENJ29_08895 [Bacteroidetes bacterium]|nr:hypothetical protein [Bacteroidota bacterium]
MKKMMTLGLFLALSLPLPAQTILQTTVGEDQLLEAGEGLQSNAIVEIKTIGSILLLGTSKGLSISEDLGRSWRLITHEDGIGRGSVTAIAARATETDTVIWVATSHDTVVAEGTLNAGGGLAVSKDMGRTWQFSPQPGPTPVQNITFDIALHDDGSTWITSFGGGTRRTFDDGLTWEVVTPDTFLFDAFCNLNHRSFSTISANGVLWVGTAGAVNKSTDDGETWTNFTHQNQDNPISGNFVVALGSQQFRGREYIWAATIQVTDTQLAGCTEFPFPGSEDQFRAVSVSDDGGYSWYTSLEGVFPHNFAFDDSIAYAATDKGLFKSIDFGRTWARYPEIYDSEQDIRYLSEDVFTVAVTPDRALWVGGPDGLAVTRDDGRTWKIIRGSRRPGQEGEKRTYAYPSPFSPARHNLSGGDGFIRFQYDTRTDTRVTVRVYDFAMDLVAEVVTGKPRTAGGSYFELWNGRNDRGEVVANGVYFYSVELEGDAVLWGKFMVMN